MRLPWDAGAGTVQTEAPAGTVIDSALMVLFDAAKQADCGAPIERAYEVAAACHRDQRRCSGDPYITHPVEVALILKDLGMSPPVLCAALLHDVLADTPYTIAQLHDEFGSEISGLVEKVTELDKDRSRYGSVADAIDAAQAISDQRVLIIKLADRLHNMRTLRHLPPVKQQRKSREVLEGFAPLARSLGMDDIEQELVDLAHAALADNPEDRASDAWPEPVRGPVLSRRLLAITAVLLPATGRERWLDEWTGELSTLPTLRCRARFTIQMLIGMPRLAAALRRRVPSTGFLSDDRHPQAGSSGGRESGEPALPPIRSRTTSGARPRRSPVAEPQQ